MDHATLRNAIKNNKYVAEMLLKDVKIPFPPAVIETGESVPEAKAYVYLNAKHWK